MPLKNVEDIYPLTPMQHLMLMHSLRSPGSSTLVNQFHYRLQGPLSETKFARAWEQVVSRHEALRTAFIWEGVPQPVQVVRKEVTLDLDFVDLHLLSDSDRATRAEEILAADRVQGFDLRRAPLLRLRVLRLKDDAHLMILTRHHLILDLWSAEIVFSEFFEAYLSQERLTSRPAGRFRHYLDWLNQQDATAAETYWTKYLQGIETPALLFGSCIRRSHWTETGQASIERAVQGETTTALTQLARELGVTTNTILQGVVSLVISALTDSRDVIFGLTVSARPPDVIHVEQIVGSLVNNIPVRTCIEDDMDSQQWLKRIQTTQSQRSNFEHVSPTDLHRWSNIAAEATLFDLLLLLQAPLMGTTTVGDLIIEPVSGPMDSALPLTLAIETGTEGFTLTAVHDVHIVSVDMAEEIVEAIASGISCAAQGIPEGLGDLRQRIGQIVPKLSTTDTQNSLTPRTALLAAESEMDLSENAAKLLQIFRESLGNPVVGLDDDFFALGGTSIQAAIAFAKIERQFDRVMPLSTLFSAGSVRNLMQALELPPPPDSALIRIQSFGSLPPIFAVSGIDGNVVGLSDLARVLGRGQPLFGLQSKALYSDDLALDTIEAIADAYIEECSEMLSEPYVLLGICFGADVVLEMAHRLSEQNRAPALVVVLDPSVEEVVKEDGESVPVATPKMPTKLSFLAERLRLMRDVYRAKSGVERLHWLREKCVTVFRKIRHGDLLDGNHLEFKQLRVRTANLAAAQHYKLRHYSGPISVLITRDRQINSKVDPRATWIERVQHEISAVPVPGRDTGDALRAHVYELASQIRKQTDAVLEG